MRHLYHDTYLAGMQGVGTAAHNAIVEDRRHLVLVDEVLRCCRRINFASSTPNGVELAILRLVEGYTHLIFHGSALSEPLPQSVILYGND